MKKSTSFNLLAALVLIPTLAAPAFAEDGKDSPGHSSTTTSSTATSSTETMQAASPDRPLLTPYPRKWWADN